MGAAAGHRPVESKLGISQRLWRLVSKISNGSAHAARHTITTLSDPQLMKPMFGLLHPPHVLRTTDKQQPSKDFLDEGTHLGKREPWDKGDPSQEGSPHAA